MPRVLERTVVTDRLVLRPFTPDDVPAYARIREKPVVVEFLKGGRGGARDADQIARDLVPDFANQWESVGYGPWAVCRREVCGPGTLLGHAGLRWLPDLGETEVLYLLDSAVWGQGLGTEAARRSVAFAFQTARLSRVIGLIKAQNHASIRVMERAGLAFQREETVWGMTVLRYGASRPAGGP